MKKTSFIILGIFFVLGLISAFLPNAERHLKLVSPAELLDKINQNHYYTTDQIAQAIWTKDPSVILIDVRTPDEYAKYTLPGALNIPIDSLLKPQYKGYIDQDAYNVVFFSNGSALAEKAWVMATGLGYENLFVLKGGINQWFTTVIMPPKPKDTDKQKDWELYEFRKAFRRYLGIGANDQQTQTSAPAPAVQVNVSQKPSEPEGGGCE